MHPFRYPALWLLLGGGGIATVIYLSLTSEPLAVPFAFSDKVGHLLAYAVLMGWCVQLFHRHRILVACGLGLLAMGVGLEFLQGMSGRYFEYADMAANGLGVFIGALSLRTPWHDILLRLERRLVR
jgi:hypothetical protein